MEKERKLISENLNMKNYKTGLIVFLFLAIIISLFPPYEWRMSKMTSELTNNLIVGKTYDFIFKFNDSNCFIKSQPGELVTKYILYRHLIIGEIILEYLLAGFFAFLVQIIVISTKRQTLNEK